ncbi:MAG: hypothetical protein K1X89_20595 [Myxococcaceae bacterium]|nr:hypothetical protein [Myxococcaceae bacterium]
MPRLAPILGVSALLLVFLAGGGCGDPTDGGAGGGAPGGSGGGGRAPDTDPGPVGRCFASDEVATESHRPLGIKTAHGICVSHSFGSSVDRAEIREAYARCLATNAQVDAGPGALEVRRDGAARVASVTFAPDGGEGWAQSFDYDDAGRVTRWTLDYAAASQDRTETFGYDPAGRISAWKRDFATTGDDVSETFTYDSGGRLADWLRDFTTGQDVAERFTFTGPGLIATWTRDFSGGSEDLTETYTYDAMNRLASWKRDYAGRTTDLTIDVSYTSTMVTASLTGATASVVVRQCPP